MLYKEYDNVKRQYKKAQDVYAKILEEKESLFLRTQPSAVAYDKDSVSNGSQNDVFAEYVSNIEAIDNRLNIAESILTAKFNLLKIKKRDLRESKDTYDRIYVYHYIDGLKVSSIAWRLSYSKSQVYRILKKIDKEIGKE